MLFNIHTLEWDRELLELFDIPKSMLPDVLSCDGSFGNLNLNNKTIPIKGVIGDQQAALVGQRCMKNGDMKSTYGTGCFLMANTEEKPVSIDEGLLTTIAYTLDGKTHYAIEGSIYSCGNIIKWLRDNMNFFETSEQSEDHLNKNGESNNVLFLPAFNGLGAPFWDSEIRGGFYGLTQDSSVEDMVTACFNSVAFQTKEITSILEKYDIQVSSLLVDGGMVKNKTFCQILANSLEKEILQPKNVESTALGACIVAMSASGENLNEIKISDVDIYKPNVENIKISKKSYKEWKSYLIHSMSSNK
jgi:glycerol kinase